LSLNTRVLTGFGRRVLPKTRLVKHIRQPTRVPGCVRDEENLGLDGPSQSGDLTVYGMS
jgi:hypothetical protein